VPVLEDDYDHEYHYSCQPLPPFAASDSEGLIIYILLFRKSHFRLHDWDLWRYRNHGPPARNFRRIVTRQNDCFYKTPWPGGCDLELSSDTCAAHDGLRGALRDVDQALAKLELMV